MDIRLKRQIVIDFVDMNDDLKGMFKNGDVLIKEHQWAGSKRYRLHVKNTPIGRGITKFAMLKYGDMIEYTNIAEVDAGGDI